MSDKRERERERVVGKVTDPSPRTPQSLPPSVSHPRQGRRDEAEEGRRGGKLEEMDDKKKARMKRIREERTREESS